MVLITGSYSSADRRTAEIYNPFNNTSCSLPQLPEGRFGHTQDGGLACGGPSSRTTCDKWSPSSGTWSMSHTLRQQRYAHVSWATASGVYLIGGALSLRTSEKVKVDGSVEDSFGLKYDTRYIHSAFYSQFSNFIFDSYACAISDADKEEVIITGGASTRTTVSVYGEAGWQRDLAPLSQGRLWHTCGSYVNGGKKVRPIMYV